MAKKSGSRKKKRDKQARQKKGYNIDAMKRGGQNLQIDMLTRMTKKTKIGKAAQNKHKKKRIFSEFDKETALFNLVFILPVTFTRPAPGGPRCA